MNKKEYMADSSSEEEEELEYLDEAIIYAWENKQVEFVEAIETFLEDFVLDKERQEEMIGNVNRFQRKVIHQLCERYNVVRTFVDIKANSDNASVTIQKTSTSEVPEMKVRELYEKHLARAQALHQKHNDAQPAPTMGAQMGMPQMNIMQQMMMQGGNMQMDPMIMQQMIMQQMMMQQGGMQMAMQQGGMQMPPMMAPQQPAPTLSYINKLNQNKQMQAQYAQQQGQSNVVGGVTKAKNQKKQVNINQIINQEEEFPAL